MSEANARGAQSPNAAETDGASLPPPISDGERGRGSRWLTAPPDLLQTIAAAATVVTFVITVVLYGRNAEVQRFLAQPIPIPTGLALLALIIVVLVAPHSARVLFRRFRRRQRLAAPSDVQAYLSPRLLGAIPAITAAADLLIIGDAAPSAFVESFRRIRTSILYPPSPARSCKIVLVTSPGPNEGKTTVATNLAIATAWADHRVLLIDCDLRRPRIHQLLAQSRTPGLTDLLLGTAKASDVVQRSFVPNLWSIPAGKISHNSAELLGSRRFADLLSKLREHFDFVMLDAPPVLSVSEPLVLAHQCDEMILVGRIRKTSVEAAKQTVAQLKEFNRAALGWVLTEVKSPRDVTMYAGLYESPYEEERV